MIRFEHVSKSYDGGRTFVVRDVSFTVPEGQTLVLLGSSGSGKTTTLKMINRLIEPSNGIIQIDGRNIAQQDPVLLRRSIGYVFQGVGLFPHMTVAENIGVSLRIRRMPSKHSSQRIAELMTMVELDPKTFAHRYPQELSGGQQQRVGVARALAAETKYLLMDEPFGALDSILRENLQQLIIRIRTQLKITIIFVTHDIFEALTLGDQIAVMHEGHLLQIADKKTLLEHPATPFVEQLFCKPRSLLALGNMHE